MNCFIYTSHHEKLNYSAVHASLRTFWRYDWSSQLYTQGSYEIKAWSRSIRSKVFQQLPCVYDCHDQSYLPIFLRSSSTVEPPVATTSLQRPVFQNTKRFSVKSLYLEPLKSDRRIERFLILKKGTIYAQGCSLTGAQQPGAPKKRIWTPKFFAAAPNTLQVRVGLLTSQLLPFWAPWNIC